MSYTADHPTGHDGRPIYLLGNGLAMVPAEPARWLKTHVAAVYAACPHCKVAAGTPCKLSNSLAWGASTHFKRRDAYKDILKREKKQ